MKSKKPISSELESRLNRLKSNEYVTVSITVNSRDAVKTLVDYLSEQGFLVEDKDKNDALKTIFVHLTKKQIYKIAEQPYVNAIMENQGIYGIS